MSFRASGDRVGTIEKEARERQRAWATHTTVAATDVWMRVTRSLDANKTKGVTAARQQMRIAPEKMRKRRAGAVKMSASTSAN